MRVRILSGNQAGCVQDVPQIEGEVLLATGFGELVPDDPPARVDPVEAAAPPASIEPPASTELPPEPSE